MPRCLPGEWKPSAVLCGPGSPAGPPRRHGTETGETLQLEAEDRHGVREESGKRRGDAPAEGQRHPEIWTCPDIPGLFTEQVGDQE